MAAGDISVALDIVQVALSKSSNFQSEAAATENEVLNNHVVLYAEDDEEPEIIKSKMPFATVALESMRWPQRTSGPGLQATGVIAVRVYHRRNRLKDTQKDIYLSFTDWLGQVIRDLAEEIGTGTGVTFGQCMIDMPEAAFRPPPDYRTDDNDFFTATIYIHYGLP